MLPKIRLLAGLTLLVMALSGGCALVYPGNYRNFTVPDLSNGMPHEVRTQLVFTGEHVELYLERGKQIVRSKLDSIGGELDAELVPRISERFAEPSDIDGNRRVIVVLMDIRDGFDPDESQYVAGFFLRKDIDGGLLSNRGEILYLDISPGLEYSGGRQTLMYTAAHELFHLIDYSLGFRRDTWLSEGLALAAEQAYTASVVEYRAELFAAGGALDGGPPAIARGNHFYHWDSPAGAGDYASAYAFFHWLLSSAAPHGASTHAVFASGAGNGEELMAALAEFPEFDYAGEMPDLLLAWHRQSAANAAGWTGWNTGGAYGNDPDLAAALADARIFAPAQWYSGRTDARLYPGDAIYITGHEQSGWSPGAAGPNISFWGLTGNAADTAVQAVDADHHMLIVFNRNPDPYGPPEPVGLLPAASGQPATADLSEARRENHSRKPSSAPRYRAVPAPPGY